MRESLYTPRMEAHLQMIENALPSYLPKREGLCARLDEAMSYACSAGGKRLRPVLTLEFCRVCGGNVQAAVPFACAVEMAHSYSLVHDDLPCMDDSPLRRGKPSVHAAFGEDIALLAGDGLLTAAFETMLEPGNRTDIPADTVALAVFTLACASGCRGMVGGQVIDLQSEKKMITLTELEELQRGKTASLITAACRIGTLLAGGDDRMLEAAASYGENIGLCFQIVDDILDATSTAQALGKPVQSDEAHQKNTYVSLLGIEKARDFARERTKQATEALRVFGGQADGLCSLANALLTRQK